MYEVPACLDTCKELISEPSNQSVNGRSIHAFNKSGRRLEFSINDVIRAKIIHDAKMATKDESPVDVDFVVLCSVFR